MVRYADDLLLFFSSEEEARQGQSFVAEQLKRVDLRLSARRQLSTGLNTTSHFLGLGLPSWRNWKKYVRTHFSSQIRKSKTSEANYSYERLLSANYAE